MSLILIDGYNVIRQSVALSDIEAKNFEKGRAALLQKLSAYKRVKPHRIIVVFDAWKTDWGHRSADRVGGIEVIYSRAGETADDVMIEMIGVEKETMIVVSSDREIATAARSKGFLVLSAREFEARLLQASYMESGSNSSNDDEPSRGRLSTKKKGPSRRLPKQKRRAIAKASHL